MQQYPPEMYEEILKDYNYRWGKFSPIPYPTVTNKDTKKSELLPKPCLLYTSPSPRDKRQSRMPSSA